RARELDPFSPAIAAGYPFILLLQRRFDLAEEEYKKLIARDPLNVGLRTGLGMALLGDGKIEEALQEYEMAAEADPSPQNIAFLAAVLAYSGKPEAARARLGELERLSQSRYVPALCLSFVHLALGDSERALELMERACEVRESLLRFLKVSFAYD